MSVENRDGWEEQGGYLEEMVPGTPNLEPRKGHYIHRIQGRIIKEIRTLNNKEPEKSQKSKDSASQDQ